LRGRRLGSKSSIRFQSASSSNGLVMPGRLRVGDTQSTKPRIKVQEATVNFATYSKGIFAILAPAVKHSP
jgi:hypothetical protein